MLTSLQRAREQELIPILGRLAGCGRKPLEQVLRHGGSPVDGLLAHGQLALRDYRAALTRIRPQPMQWGPFLVAEELGRGSTGVVYRARWEGDEADVALKILRDEEVAKRFEREADLLARLTHPGIVRLLRRGQEEEAHYLVTELLSVESLASLREPWAPAPALDLILSVCDALAHAHAQGVVHRDLKPANVLLARDGSPKLVDFGLAKDLHADTLTRSQTFLGTPAYAAPEQLTSARDVDARADLYAVGGLLYFLLTGEPPFPAQSLRELLPFLRQGFKPRQPIPGLSPALMAQLNGVWIRCLTPDLNLRYATTPELQADLRTARQLAG